MFVENYLFNNFFLLSYVYGWGWLFVVLYSRTLPFRQVVKMKQILSFMKKKKKCGEGKPFEFCNKIKFMQMFLIFPSFDRTVKCFNIRTHSCIKLQKNFLSAAGKTQVKHRIGAFTRCSKRFSYRVMGMLWFVCQNCINFEMGFRSISSCMLYS